MRLRLIHGLVALPIAAMLMSASGVSGGAPSFSSRFQAVQAEQDPVKSVVEWEALVKESAGQKEVLPGVSQDTLRQNFIRALIDACKGTTDVTYCGRVAEVARPLPPEKQAEMLTLLAEAQLQLSPDEVLATVQRTRTLLDAIPQPTQQNQARYALLSTVLKYRGDNSILRAGINEVSERELPRVTVPQLRIELLQLFAQSRLTQLKLPYDSAKTLLPLVQKNLKSDLKAALSLALALPMAEAEEKTARNSALLQIHEAAMAADHFTLALDALGGMEINDQENRLKTLFDATLEKSEASRAMRVAERLSGSRYAAISWAAVARHYAKFNQSERAKEAQNRAFASLYFIEDNADRPTMLAAVATLIAESGNAKMAQSILASARITDAAIISPVLAAIVVAQAEAGDVKQAEKIFEQLKNPEDRKKVLPHLASALAKQDAAKAVNLLADARGAAYDAAWYDAGKAWLDKGDEEAARKIIENIGDAVLQAKLRAKLAEKETSRDKTSGIKLFQDALAAVPQSGDATVTRKALSTITTAMAEAGLEAETQELFPQITDTSARDEVLQAVAVARITKGDLEGALAASRAIGNTGTRVKALRAVAEIQARRMDAYHLLARESTSETVLNPGIIPETRREEKSRIDDFMTRSADTSNQTLAVPSVYTRPGSGLGRNLPPLPYPERLAYNADYINNRLPLSGNASITRLYYENSEFINAKFQNVLRNVPSNFTRESITPEIIYIESGIMDIPQLYDTLRARGTPEYLTRDGNVYTLRHPVLIGLSAALVIDGSEVGTLRLSKEAGAFIANAGKLHIHGTSIVGWSEEKQAAAHAVYEDHFDFRPFITSWSYSSTYIGAAELVSLGYGNQKSYGLSITSGPKAMTDITKYPAQRPSAIIVDSSFRNMLYGFYSYEADDVALIGNEYVDNIVYGVDPHDRSHRLTIAYNSAYGSYRKHGIIISRDVNDSSYIGNICFENKGSGFMVDRLSNGTFIYANTAYKNVQDGLTLFESGCNLIASNYLAANGWVGLRVRNSLDNGVFFNTIENNQRAGIYGYTAILEESAAQVGRNYTIDPYYSVAAMTLVGNHIEKNKMGVSVEEFDALYMNANSFPNQAPKIFYGKWFLKNPFILSQFDQSREGALITENCLDGTLIPQECSFRKAGFIKGDGQDEIEARVKASSACSGKIVTRSH